MTSFHRLAPFSERSATSSSVFLPRTPCSLSPATTLSLIDIVGNGFGRWNTMPMVLRTLDRVDSGAVDVLAVEQHRALGPGAGQHFVHPVQRAQHGGLAAARRPDEAPSRCAAGTDSATSATA